MVTAEGEGRRSGQGAQDSQPLGEPCAETFLPGAPRWPEVVSLVLRRHWLGATGQHVASAQAGQSPELPGRAAAFLEGDQSGHFRAGHIRPRTRFSSAAFPGGASLLLSHVASFP